MNRVDWSWHSPTLDRVVHLTRWGHYGKPILFFPTAGGDHEDPERWKMIYALRPLLEAGRVKIYGCGQVNREGWMSLDHTPTQKSAIHARFDAMLVNEMLPRIAEDCDGHRTLGCVGASLGAYNAVNAAAKHPDWFDLAIGMSGYYDPEPFMNGERNLDHYYNNPMCFLPNLGECEQLTLLRRARFVIAYGRGRWESPDQSNRMARVLAARDIPVNLEVWGPDADHDWPTWRTMLPTFLNRLV